MCGAVLGSHKAEFLCLVVRRGGIIIEFAMEVGIGGEMGCKFEGLISARVCSAWGTRRHQRWRGKWESTVLSPDTK